MSSGPPILPPLQATQSVKAAIQAVAVKLINVPSSLENNPSPVRLKGEVTGQTDRGSVLVETERGLVELILKDRQSLPKGTRIEIDVPAGRPPQSGNIRPDSTSQQQAPTLAQTTRGEVRQEPTRLDRSSHIDPRTLENVISSKSDALTQSLAESRANAPIAKGNLEIGQYVRLTPISPSALNGLGASPLASVSSLEQILSGLVEFYQQSSGAQAGALRLGIAALLSQITIPGSLVGASNDTSSPLIQNIKNILQSSGLTNNSLVAASGGTSLNTPLEQGLFSPSIPLDAQILATHIFPNSALDNAGDSFLPSPFNTGSQTAFGGTPPSTQSLTGIPSPPAPSVAIGHVPDVSGANKAGSLNNGQIFVTLQSGGTGPHSAAGASTFTTVGQMVGATSQNLPILALLPSGSSIPQYYVMQFQADNLTAGLSGSVSASASTTEASSPVASRLFLSVQPLGQPVEAAKNPIWTSLQDIIDFLQMQAASNLGAGLAAASAAHAMSNMLPSPAHPANLGALATLFLSLFRGGDLESFMPSNALDLLRQSARGKSLLDALSTEINRGGRGENTTISGDWRGVYIPFAWDQNIHKIPLYYKEMEQNSEGEAERKRRRMRFLFDLNLSRMGDVQIDGFLQPAETSTRLDLVMRTRTPLSAPMQSRMKQIYAGAVERSQIIGDLSFQFRPDQWVDFGDELEVSTLNA